MRSELNEMALIDSYLFRQLDDKETQAFETTRLRNEAFAEKVETQRLAHRLIRLYGRNQERRRLERIHRQLIQERSFADQINNI